MRLSLLIFVLMFYSIAGFGTTHYISNSGNTFTPDTITITVGDTVDFNISSSHNAIEVSATTWNNNGNSQLSGGFQVSYGGGLALPSYLTAGTHYYVCSPHAFMGMKGVIIVQSCAPATPGTITGNSAVCSGGNYNYSISAVSGATSYTWTLPSGWSGTSTTNTITATVGSSGGNISVTANNSCGSSSAKTLSVSVSSIPSTPGSISGSSTVCSGSTGNNYSISPVNGATSYTWTLPSGWSGSSTTTSISASAGSAGGNITVKANNFCGSSSTNSLAVNINSIPSSPGAISGDTAICSGIAYVYKISPVNGATTYTWTLPTGWSGSSTTDSIKIIPGTTGGNLKVTANNTCGSSSAATLAVSVGSIPSKPLNINGDTNVCLSGSYTYHTADVNNATSYSWTLPSGWSGASSVDSINTTAGSLSGNIEVSANNYCGSSPKASIFVNVNTSVPVISGNITGDTLACDSSLHQFSISSVNNATSYTWTLPSSWSGSSNTNSIIASVYTTGGSVTVTANNSCGSSAPVSLLVKLSGGTALKQPGPITGDTVICKGSIQTYSVPADSNASSYKWILPMGWTGSSSTNSITVTANENSGDIMVSAQNYCGMSVYGKIAVNVISVPSLNDSISGDKQICAGAEHIYSIKAVQDATSYTWTLPGGWSGNSVSNSISATSGNLGGIITVTADNKCGSSSSLSLNVSVTTQPDTPGIIDGNSNVCASSNNIYSIDPVPGATSYSWSLPTGWIGNSSSNTISITAGETDGNIEVIARNACGSSVPAVLSVSSHKVNTAVTQNESMLTALDSGATYQWINCNDNTPLSGETGQVFQVTKNGSYAVVVTKNGCTDTSTCYEVIKTGIVNEKADLSVSVYPNPSNGAFRIIVENVYTADKPFIEILDMQGKQIFNAYSNISEINLENQLKGIYILKVTHGADIFIERLIIR